MRSRLPLQLLALVLLGCSIVGSSTRAAPKGSNGGNGKRDDLNGKAVTFPVWFTTGVAAAFVWSVKSSIYHDPDCWAARKLRTANRREGSAPAGKTRHECHPWGNQSQFS